MPYIIDGHNLIPRIPGLTLADLDDEDQLIDLLLKYCRHKHKRLEVFFDNAPPGGVRAHTYGPVVARFVRQGATADEAIRGRLMRLGRAVRNWTVVSSDQAVRASAHAAQARYISSEAFAELLLQVMSDTRKDKGENTEFSMNSDELDDWLQLFSSNEGK